MKILFLSQRVPYPPDRGDKITTYHVMRHLKERHELVSGCFLEEPKEEGYAAKLRGMGVRVHGFPIRPRARKLWALRALLTTQPITLPYFYDRRLANAVASEVAQGVDLLLAYSSSMGQYFSPYPALPKIQIFAELDSDKWLQYARNHSFPGSWIYGREHRRLLRFERELAHAVDACTVVSEVERELFLKQIPGANVAILPNGVDLEAFRPGPEGAREPATLLFTGVMDYGANVDGMLWFHREIWPQLKQAIPQARLLIVGSRPVPAIRALAASDVEVTGFVESTRPYFERATVAIAPLRIARGIQNKVLEAMASGLPTISSPSAFSGIDAQPGRDLLVADEPPAWVDALVGLLRDRERREALGKAARVRMETAYRWDAILGQLDHLIADARARAAARAR
ncbi:MAG: TIGR03087 family PEP-CTERM/XrtA system glycosyltransferase [Planctomycetes bacterium]|nr:TIGR03087 family PEP-CTERM/XrtA system glycosyltransferase [Planctomycetota bacterium]